MKIKTPPAAIKVTAILLAALTVLLAFSSCTREKGRDEEHKNMEFVLDKETDTYTLAYYTDTTKVKTLVIPETFNGKKVTALGRLAVASCDTLERVVIGKNLESIDPWGIVDCRYLRAIEVDPENARFQSLDGVLYSKDGTRLITYPNAHTAVYSEGGSLQKKATYTVAPGTKVIGHAAFYKCYALEKVLLPGGLEVIEARAFHKCDAMPAIDFPEGLVSIGMDAFLGCESLTELTLPSTLREIGDTAFFNALNIKAIRIKAAQEDVTLGNKWWPSSAGRQLAVEITWG